ncbi:hypothetical protein J437_LFUL019385, partial [Ladona fulva]
MPRHPISNVHEWINEIPTLPNQIIKDLELEEFKDNVYNQNMKDSNIDQETFKSGFRFTFTTGCDDSKYCNRVFTVTPLIRDILLQIERVYSGWTSHYLKDYIGVTRCYKCQGFGHTAQSCCEKNDICAHCARSGHTIEDCPRKDKRE